METEAPDFHFVKEHGNSIHVSAQIRAKPQIFQDSTEGEIISNTAFLVH